MDRKVSANLSDRGYCKRIAEGDVHLAWDWSRIPPISDRRLCFAVPASCALSFQNRRQACSMKPVLWENVALLLV